MGDRGQQHDLCQVFLLALLVSRTAGCQAAGALGHEPGDARVPSRCLPPSHGALFLIRRENLASQARIIGTFPNIWSGGVTVTGAGHAHLPHSWACPGLRKADPCGPRGQGPGVPPVPMQQVQLLCWAPPAEEAEAGQEETRPSSSPHPGLRTAHSLPPTPRGDDSALPERPMTTWPGLTQQGPRCHPHSRTMDDGARSPDHACSARGRIGSPGWRQGPGLLLSCLPQSRQEGRK